MKLVCDFEIIQGEGLRSDLKKALKKLRPQDILFKIEGWRVIYVYNRENDGFDRVMNKDMYAIHEQILNGVADSKMFFVFADGRKMDQKERLLEFIQTMKLHVLWNYIKNSDAKPLTSTVLAKTFEMKHQEMCDLLKSMSFRKLIGFEVRPMTKKKVNDEGLIYARNGTPEYFYAQMIKENEGIDIKGSITMFSERVSSIYPKLPIANPTAVAQLAMGNAKKMKYVKVDKNKLIVDNISEDIVRIQLMAVANNQKLSNEILNDLSKRSLLIEVKKSYFEVSALDWVDSQVALLDEDMVISGEWEGIDFAPLNFDVLDFNLPSGHEHPLLKVRSEFRQVFLQMGFEEMDTSKWVENSFWNFDTLFQGQQHPCRDMHDTFFMSVPEYGKMPADKDYFDRVKVMHEKGGNGSIGLRYEYSETIPLTNILRTHTTAVSSRVLKSIADEYQKTGEIRPRKFFSIDRVYRNETLDATHLAEFHQVEGFVLDKNLSLGDLMNHVREFFGRIGLNEIEFKPAYNPYTEPSMEIFAKHEGLGRWIEIGNSGMFRPEMLVPMNLPEGWSVIAWGFSLERPTMIEYKINEIRKLEGPNVSLDLIENVPICRLTF